MLQQYLYIVFFGTTYFYIISMDFQRKLQKLLEWDEQQQTNNQKERKINQ